MNERRISVGEYRSLELRDLSGDLVVKTWAAREILVVSEGESALSATEGALSLTCDRHCTLTLPHDFDLHFSRISGDAHFADLTGSVEGGSVAGNVQLLRTGAAKIAEISGDLVAGRVSGDLEIGRVGGDLTVDALQGRLSAKVGGDLKAAAVAGGVNAAAGGDVAVEFVSLDTATQAIQAGGDVACRLPADANVTISPRCGGAHTLNGRRITASKDGTAAPITLGSGDAVLDLLAGGDLTLWTGPKDSGSAASETNSNPDCADVFASLTEQALRQLADHLEIHLGALASQLDDRLGDAEMSAEIAARVQERVQKAMQRAEQKISQAVRAAERSAARAEKRAAHAHGHRQPHQWYAAPPPPAQAKRPSANNEESALILRMVQEGKLSIEQAEQLLSAMGAEEA